jgi:hypothetical protein
MSVISLLALSGVIYTFVAYPVAVALLARRHARARSVSHPQAPAPERSVSVCMAVHDGAKFIRDKLDSVLAVNYPAHLLEVIVYTDGSRDGTDAIVEQYAATDPRVRLLRGSARRGKPTALNEMAQAARGDILLMTDVRQPLDAESVRALVRELADPSVGCVSGNLELRGAEGAGAYWKYEKLIRKSEGRLGKMVGVSGSIYAIRRSEFPHVPEDIVLDDMWVPVNVALSGKRIVFCDDAIAYDVAFADEAEFGRKVRTIGGNYQLLRRLPALLSPVHNPLFLQLVSHKVLRLLVPWMLVALFVDSWLCALVWPPTDQFESNVVWALAYGQTTFYALAAVGSRAGKLGAIARTFVVMNVAAVVGLWRYTRGELRVTW